MRRIRNFMVIGLALVASACADTGQVKSLPDNPENRTAAAKRFIEAMPPKDLLQGMGARMGAEHYGEERHESAAQRAESVVEEELRKRRLSRAELAALPKGHRAKVEMARRLQAETTVPVRWIAEHLEMGTRSYAYRLLYLDRKKRSRRR